MKRILISIFLLISAIGVMADENITFQASAPKQVVQGQPFQVTYIVNHRAGDITPPEFVDFEYLAGPYTSTSQSSTFVNGQFTSTYQQQYTYTLRPDKQGTFTLGAATIKVGSKQYTSNGLRITVLPPDESVQASGNSNKKSNASSAGKTSATTGNGDIFIRTIASKTTLHEQEVLTLSYKLYVTGMDIRGFTEKTQIPEFTGFLKQELDQKDIQFELEHYNNRNYQVATIYQTLLYPQHAGDIEIESGSFEAIILLPNTHRRSFFDDAYIQATKMLKAPGITIHAKSLPAGKPADFSGAVGRFSMTQSISETELTTNDAVTIKLDLSGAGNMKLIKTPAVDWPEGFEPYDPKVTNNFQTSSSGVSGSKSIEYLAIARNSGDYTIPSITFSYYDTQESQYKTLQTPEYTLHVKKGVGDASTGNQGTMANYTQKEDIKELGTDIRYIYTGDLRHTNTNGRLKFNSLLFHLLFLIPLAIAIAIFIIFRKRIKENADQTKVRYRKANKVAQRRLKAASRMLQANDKEHFYEEIEKASFTYLSDRLSIPTADLSKDNIADILRHKGIDDNLIHDVLDVLSTAEFARYAPSSDHQMQEMFNTTTQLINNLENQKL
ncbi:MAG: BatD family protein [Paludibacteraceae bacterium]|nr:BatD family protein [Paludibacteraceae bacterium]